MCADITMCLNEECPSKEECKRFTAQPSDFQSYGIFDFYFGDRCESFISNGKPTTEQLKG